MRLPFVPALALLAACATTPAAPELAPTGPVVKELVVLGNREVSDALIRRAIATRETTRFLFFGSVHRLDPGAVAQDVRRIRDLYEEQGFYAARVEAQVEELGPDEVAVVFRVAEGPPTVVRSFLVDGFETLSERQIAEVLEDPPFTTGDRFVEPEWIEWKETVLRRLRERGFAEASLEARVEVGPAEGSADLILVAAPGEPHRIGEIRVVGNLLVPERKIHEAASVVLNPGDRFSPSALEEAQAEVFALGAFSVVTVTDRDPGGEATEPEALAVREEPGDPTLASETEGEGGPAVVPVVIAVNEADFLRLRLGAGVGIDQSYYQARILGEFTHLNVFGGMQELRWINQIAYRFINPGAELAGESGLAGGSALQLVEPDFFSPRIDLLGRVEYERELRPAYTAQSVSGRIGTPVRFRRWLYFTPSYNITRFFDVTVFDEDELDPVVPGVQPSLVGDCPQGCLLSWLEQRIVADRRDQPLEPHRGWYASFGLQEGGLGGDFAWLRFLPEVRGYIPLGDAFVLAGRLELGYLLPLSECDAEQARDPYLAAVDCSPIVVRFFGGGADGFRGVGADRLSPLRVVNPDSDPRYIPLGGNATLLATGELRWYFAESWSSAFFLDIGNVAERPSTTFDLREAQYAAGAGIRYRTPIGPVRLDLGYRFLREPTYPVGGGPAVEKNTWDYFALFISIGEAF